MKHSLFDTEKSEAVALAKKIIKDKDTREKAILYISTVMNYFFVIFQLYGGIRYKSGWFTALGVYYAVLTSVNLYVGLSHEKQGREAWKVFRISGWALTLANLALIAIISIMIATPGVAVRNYSPIIAVGVMFWTFYLLISAVIGIAKQWRKKNVIVMAENSIQLIGATVSILMLQTSMIVSYGAQAIEEAKNTLEQMSGIVNTSVEMERTVDDLIQIFATSNRITGILVIVVVLAITVYMIVKGSREYKKFRE